MIRRSLITFLVALSLVSRTFSQEPLPVFAIRRPTVVAFFVQAGQGAQQDGENEALDDFQFYLPRARKDLGKEGVDLKVVYASSFKVRLRSETRIFRPGEIKVGYYFIAPGKQARVEYGVLTDEDISHIAHEYFGRAPKLQGARH